MRIVIVPVLLAIFAIQSILSISIDIPDPEEQVLNTLNECLDDIEGVSNGIESFKTLIDFMKRCGIKFEKQPSDPDPVYLATFVVSRLQICKYDPNYFISGEIADNYRGQNTVIVDYDTMAVLLEYCGNEDTYPEDMQLISGLYPDH